MKLALRRTWGFIARILYPGFGSCGRCDRPWSVCECHTTNYSGSGYGGCFPLCEECWSELTPQTRLPYYRDLVDWWMTMTSDLNGQPWGELWDDMKAAVLAGK